MLFSLRSRLMAVFSVLLILPFAALAVILSGAATKIIKHSIESSNLQTIEQFASHAGTLLTQIEDTGKQILSSTATQEWLAVQLNAESTVEERVRAKQKLRNAFSSHSINNSNGISISAFLDREGGVWAQDKSYLAAEWYAEFQRDGKRWTRAHKDPDQPDAIMNSRFVNSFLFPLVQLQSLNRVGLIKVNYPTALLRTAIDKIRFGDTGQAYLLSAGGGSVLNQDIAADAEVLAEGLNRIGDPASGAPSGMFPVKRGGKDYLLFYRKLPVQNWVIIGTVPEAEIYRKITDIRHLMLVVTVVLIFLAILSAYALSAGITRPLSVMARAMKHVKNGEFGQALEVMPKVRKGHSELNYVSDVFEEMTRRLRYLIETEFETNLRRKNAEYKALLLQINPHFYYNTLEIISGLAARKREDLVMDATEALGKMMRYSLNLNSDLVRVEEEIKYLRDYLFILQLRHEERIEITIEEDPQSRELMIPKFILQPLLENAVKYSLEQDGPARVLLRTSLEGERLLLAVKDNGIGMDGELIKNVLDEVQTNSASILHSGGHSIGLRNVLSRCCLHYGERFRVEIRSEVGAGTEIIMSLPQARS